MRDFVTGGAGFIGSHLAKRMKSEGWYVICADWKDNEFMKRARAHAPSRRDSA